MTKRAGFVALVVVPIALVACSQGSGRDFARYYDEQGLFTVDLPSANDITVATPQTAAEGPQLLTGVVSSPPAPSPAPQTGFGGLGTAATEQPDLTIYRAFAITSDGFADLEEMTLFFITGDPLIDVVTDDRTRLAGTPARLVVADVVDGGEVTASVAAAITLGDGETGYLLAAIFPPGEWECGARGLRPGPVLLRRERPAGARHVPDGRPGVLAGSAFPLAGRDSNPNFQGQNLASCH